MAVLGIATGVVTAVVILGFRFLIDTPLSLIPGGQENFEDLPVLTRVALVLGGALVLGMLLNRYRPAARRVGVVHVMERLSRHQGHLPLKNAADPVLSAAPSPSFPASPAAAKGPAIHLGATAASLLGRASQPAQQQHPHAW